MIRALAAFLLLALAADAAWAQGPRAFVEIRADRDQVYVGGVAKVRLRVGVDREFFEMHAVPLFRQETDLPVQVRAPWLDDLDAGRIVAPRPDDRRLSLALADRVVDAVRVEDERVAGRLFTVAEIVIPWRFEEPGAFLLVAPTLRYAFAARFEEDFLGDRLAVDRQDVTVEGEEKTFWVHAWPTRDRPPGFMDAIGRFDVRASATPGEDAPWTLTLEIAGEGNLETLTPPAPDAMEGFHVLGAIDDAKAPVRTIRYDLEPIDETVGAIPSIAFAYLDPDPPGSYHVVRTDPIPIGGSGEDASGSNVGVAPDFTGWLLRLLAFGVIVLLVLGAVVATGLRRRLPEDDGVARARARLRDATDALRRAAADAEDDVEARLTEYLAARLRIAPAAVIAPKLGARLAAAGLAPDVAEEVDSLLERLVEARYGGAGAETVVHPAFVERLDSSWR